METFKRIINIRHPMRMNYHRLSPVTILVESEFMLRENYSHKMIKFLQANQLARFVTLQYQILMIQKQIQIKQPLVKTFSLVWRLYSIITGQPFLCNPNESIQPSNQFNQNIGSPFLLRVLNGRIFSRFSHVD